MLPANRHRTGSRVLAYLRGGYLKRRGLRLPEREHHLSLVVGVETLDFLDLVVLGMKGCHHAWLSACVVGKM